MAFKPSDMVLHELEARFSSRPHVAMPASQADHSTNQCPPGVRRVNTEVAAKYVGHSVRTLEDWRESWRQAIEQGKPERRKGPKFFKFGKRVLYDLHDLDHFIAIRKVQGVNRG